MMKKIIAIVMCIMLVCSVITTVSADETTEYITFDLRQAGANAKIFGNTDIADSIVSASTNKASTENAPDEYIKNYQSGNLAISGDSGRGARVISVLRKDSFDAMKKVDGFIYDSTGKIPFLVSTDIDTNNGIILGRSNISAQTIDVNSDKPFSKLYVFYVTTLNYDGDAVITYDDNTTETKTVEFKETQRDDDNTTTGIWSEKTSLRYNFSNTKSGDVVAVSYSNDADRRTNIAVVETNVLKKVKSISLRVNDNYGSCAVFGITGRVSTEDEIASGATTMNLAALKAKFADASVITMANCNDASALLAEINDEFVPVEDAEYVASIRAAVEAIFTQVDETVSKYDILEISKNVPLAANVGDTTKVIGIDFNIDDPTLETDNNKDMYAFNIAALNYKAVKGYTFSVDNIPFKIEADSNGYYGRKITGKANPAAELTGTYELTIPEGKKYTKISFVAPASGTSTQDRDDLSYKLVYDNGTANGETVVYNQSKIQWNTVVREDNKSSLINDPKASYILYETDANNRNNTYNWLTYDYSAGKYLSDNVTFLNTYVPVYNLPVDPTKTLKKVVITCTPEWFANTILAATAQKAYLSDVIDTLEVTAENYKDVSKMIEELPEGNLTPAQEEKIEVIKKQILYFNQEYIPFDIDAFSNSTVFASNGTATSSVVAGNYITVGSSIAVLNKEGWESKKDTNGLVYAANGIPFDVNTDGSILFGALNGASVEIDIENGNYDSISALIAHTSVDANAFEMRVEYTEGEPTVDPGWNIQNYHYTTNPFTRGNAEHTKDSDSYYGFENPTLRNTADPSKYEVFKTRYYFPVVTLDVDKNRVVDKIVLTNRVSNVDIALLGLTGSKVDSTHKTLTRVFNSAMLTFSDEEIEAAHTAYVNSYNIGLYTNKTYGIEPMGIAYLKYNENVLSGKVMSYVNTDNDYTVVAIVLNADGSFDRVEIMGQGTANLSAHDFSETIVLDEGQKLNVLLWESFATLKPYMTAKVVK